MPLNKVFLILIILSFSSQIANSQPSLVTVNIIPDTSVTSGKIVFHCTITNPTNKNYRYFDFDPNCEPHYDPHFWKISIRKNTVDYFDCSSEFLLINRIRDPEVKLYKKSTRIFDFCLSLNKLCPGLDSPSVLDESKPYSDFIKFVKDYTNESYGIYEVRIYYLKDPFDIKNPLSLISNWTIVEYVKD
jgi:hypothetical protein